MSPRGDRSRAVVLLLFLGMPGWFFWAGGSVWGLLLAFIWLSDGWAGLRLGAHDEPALVWVLGAGLMALLGQGMLTFERILLGCQGVGDVSIRGRRFLMLKLARDLCVSFGIATLALLMMNTQPVLPIWIILAVVCVLGIALHGIGERAERR